MKAKKRIINTNIRLNLCDEQDGQAMAVENATNTVSGLSNSLDDIEKNINPTQEQLLQR